MRRASARELEEAFETAARSPSGGEVTSEPLVRTAGRVLGARRADRAEEPCPVAALRRVQAAFALRPVGVGKRLLRLVFDSGRAAAPATRGRPVGVRTVRYETGGATLDLQVREAPSGGLALHVAVHPAVRGSSLEVLLKPGGTSRHVRLDTLGTGELALPEGTRAIRAILRVAGAEAFRVRPLTLV